MVVLSLPPLGHHTRSCTGPENNPVLLIASSFQNRVNLPLAIWLLHCLSNRGQVWVKLCCIDDSFSYAYN